MKDKPLRVTTSPALSDLNVTSAPAITGASGNLMLAKASATSPALLDTSVVYFKPPMMMDSPGFMALKVTSLVSVMPNVAASNDVEVGIPAVTRTAVVTAGSEVVL